MDCRQSLVRRDVLVIGDMTSQPQQVLAEVLNGFLNARGGEVAESAPLRRRPSTCRKPTSAVHCAASRSRASAQRHSVLVANNEGRPVRCNLTALTHHGLGATSSSSPSKQQSRLSAPHSDIVIVTFSVHSRDSFEAAHRIMSKAAKRNSTQLAGNKSSHTQFVLVGHHAKTVDEDDDLMSADWDQEESWTPSLWQQRDIHEEEARQLAKDQRHCSYQELCTDPSCSLEDCSTIATSICDDLLLTTTTPSSSSGSNRRASKELGLKKWLKASLKPKCLTKGDDKSEEEEEEDGIQTLSTCSSSQMGSVNWWDESSEGAASQWSHVVDIDSASLSTASPSLPASPLRSSDLATSPPSSQSYSWSGMSDAGCTLVIESF